MAVRTKIIEEQLTIINSMKQRPFSWSHRIRSFKYAFAGIRDFIFYEHNTWLHLVATAGVIALAAFIRVSKTEWLALVFVMALVWVAEAFNTCVERILDFISRDKHPDIRFIKDLAAGGVLIAAIAAFVTACIIFIPKFIA